MIVRDVCLKCPHYMGTWKTGPRHGVRCKAGLLRHKAERFRLPLDAKIPESCPFSAEQVVSQPVRK